MDNKSRSTSNISLDSLEIEYKKESLKQKVHDENVDTILVPLYEKDVFIKVPKIKKKKVNQHDDKTNKKFSKTQKEEFELTNYLLNKDQRRTKKSSYLEMFRKQFTSNFTQKTQNNRISNEIRSLSPEFGDTERESIGNESNNPTNDFYNTESYNDIFYDKLMKRELEQYFEQSFEDVLHFDDDVNNFKDGIHDNNLRSVSEVSQPRRRVRNKIVSPIQNVRLGGLGPDVEKIKPRLDRARSLQRYSEKVRMENRLKIYKNEVRNEKIEKESSATRRNPMRKHIKDNSNNSSYLINKTVQDKPSLIKKICPAISKSADIHKHRQKEKVKEITDVFNKGEKNKKAVNLKQNKNSDRMKTKSARDHSVGEDIKVLNLRAKNRGTIAKSKQSDGISPLQINFMVNVSGMRPSTALKSLEEKHRMYQEKVKQYVHI